MNVPTNGAFFDWSGGWSDPRWVTAETMLVVLLAVLEGGADVEDAEDADDDEADEEEADDGMAGTVGSASAWEQNAEEKGSDRDDDGVGTATSLLLLLLLLLLLFGLSLSQSPNAYTVVAAVAAVNAIPAIRKFDLLGKVVGAEEGRADPDSPPAADTSCSRGGAGSTPPCEGGGFTGATDGDGIGEVEAEQGPLAWELLRTVEVSIAAGRGQAAWVLQEMQVFPR